MLIVVLRGYFCICYFSFPGLFIIQRFVIWCFGVYLVYILLCSIARNIVLVVIVISHDYSLPLSKLFCSKGSLNLKERRGNFLMVFCESCTFKMVQLNRPFCNVRKFTFLCNIGICSWGFVVALIMRRM